MDSFRRLVVSFKINYSIDEHSINSSWTTSHLSLIVPHTNNYIRYMMSLYLCHPTVTSYLLVTFIIICRDTDNFQSRRDRTLDSHTVQSWSVSMQFLINSLQITGGGMGGINSRKGVV